MPDFVDNWTAQDSFTGASGILLNLALEMLPWESESQKETVLKKGEKHDLCPGQKG